MARERDHRYFRFGGRVLRCKAGSINMSRRLVHWMNWIQLPRTALRMRYVRLVHAFHVLDGSCTHHNLIFAMQTLLTGWVGIESTQGNQRLCEAISEFQAKVMLYCA